MRHNDDSWNKFCDAIRAHERELKKVKAEAARIRKQVENDLKAILARRSA